MLKKLAPLALALLAPISAQACRYMVQVYGEGDSSWFREVVTEEFCHRYPDGKYEIVVFNNQFSFPEQAVTTAIAYVSPVMKNSDATRPVTTRYSGVSLGPNRDRAVLVKRASIIAVQNLMDHEAPDQAPAPVNSVSQAPSPAALNYPVTSRVAQPEAPAALPLPGQPGYVTTFPEAAKMTGSGGAPY